MLVLWCKQLCWDGIGTDALRALSLVVVVACFEQLYWRLASLLRFSLFKACTPKQVLHHTHAVPDGGVGLHPHPSRLLFPHVLVPH